MDPWAMPIKIRLKDVVFTPECLDLFTAEIAKKYCAIPIGLTIPQYGATIIKIAVVDPNDLFVVDWISAYLLGGFKDNVDIDFVTADKSELLKYIEKHYDTSKEEYNEIIESMEEKYGDYRIDRGF